MRFIFRGRRSIWWVWTMTLVTPRIVNNVSCVKRINDECHFSWQAQYLVKCKCHFSWQAQYLVKCKCHFSWQAQYLVKCKCHFSWQAQYSVKFGMIAGARNVVLFNTKCSWWAWKVTSVARRVADWRFHARIMVGSWSDRPHIGNDVSSVFSKFVWDFGRSFFVAGAVFGEFGLWRMLLRAL